MNLKSMDEQGMYMQTKPVHAFPMSRAEYNIMRGWTVPLSEDPQDEGMLVVTDMDKDDEHLCWKTMDVFKASYVAIEGSMEY